MGNGSWIAIQTADCRAAPSGIRTPATADIFNISITTGMVGRMMTYWAAPAIGRHVMATAAGRASGG
jgi:hypothetical protein